VAKKGKKSSKATEWTFLEQAFAVIIALLIIVATYAFLAKEEVVEVASIETYKGNVDLRGGDEDNSSQSFDRQLNEDYQVHVRYKVPYAGQRPQPIVHCWTPRTRATTSSSGGSMQMPARDPPGWTTRS